MLQQARDLGRLLRMNKPGVKELRLGYAVDGLDEELSWRMSQFMFYGSPDLTRALLDG